jgi:hypothetical protein
MCIPGIRSINALTGARRARHSYEAQARLERIAAKQDVRDADFAVRNLGRGVAMQVGQARAALATGGADVTTGSAALIQGDFARVAELDAVVIQNNAARSAWGHRTRNRFLKWSADLSDLQARQDAYNFLLDDIAKLAQSGFNPSSVLGGGSGGATGGFNPGTVGASNPSAPSQIEMPS